MGVYIDRVLADAPGDDVARGGGEFVQLRNGTASPVDVSGWSVRDENQHVLTIPAGSVVEPFGTIRIHPGAGAGGPRTIFDGRRRAVINNEGDRLRLVDPTGVTVYTLTTGDLADFGFTPQPDLASRALMMLFDGDDPLGFGSSSLFTAVVELGLSGEAIALQDARIVSSEKIQAPLPAELKAGWYDITLTVVENATQTARSATRRLVPFGDVSLATLLIDEDRGRRFGEYIDVVVVEPVGKALGELGIEKHRLSPTLRRAADGEVVEFPAVESVGERSIRLELPAEYPQYDAARPMHVIEPGFPAGTLTPDGLLKLELLPLKPEVRQIEHVLRSLLDVKPNGPAKPGDTATWSVVTRDESELTRPHDTSATVFQAIKTLLLELPARLDLTPSVQVWAERDETGFSGPWLDPAFPLAPVRDVHPSSVAHTFTTRIRPRCVTLRANWADVGTEADLWAAVDGVAAKATLRLEVVAHLDPTVMPTPVSVTVAATVPLLQLPLAVPRFAILTSEKYEDGVLPTKRSLVLLDGITLPTAKIGEPSSGLAPITTALEAVRTALNALGGLVRFAGFDEETTVGENGLSRLLTAASEVTVSSHRSVRHLGELGRGVPNWEDDASAVFLVGLPTGRTLRLFAERTTSPRESAYLDLQLPPGHLTAALWTLHESVFLPGFGPAPPFPAITCPDPGGQRDDAEASEERPNMPWYPLVQKHSFGNVVSAFQWFGSES